jgi:ATP-dependent DNA helicase RecQ
MRCCACIFLLTSQNGIGVASFFATLRRALRPALHEAAAAWSRATAGEVCITGLRRIIEEWLPDPQWHLPLAYTLAWLRVAGGNSVLPPWVKLTFPKTGDAIAALRDVPFTDPACAWCREQHDLERMLPHDSRSGVRPPPTAHIGGTGRNAGCFYCLSVDASRCRRTRIRLP